MGELHEDLEDKEWRNKEHSNSRGVCFKVGGSLEVVSRVLSTIEATRKLIRHESYGRKAEPRERKGLKSMKGGKEKVEES